MLFEFAAGAVTVGVPVNEGELIFAFKAISEFKLVMLEVLAAIEFVFAVRLAVFDATVFDNDVILEVFDAIEFVFAVTLAMLLAMSVIFVVILEVFAAIANVLLVILFVFDDTIVFKVAISAALEVILEVFAAIAFVLDVILAVLAAIAVGKVAIVDELTPPTLFTVGKSAVPPKSFVNLSLPLLVASASGVYEPPTKVETNAVVAN